MTVRCNTVPGDGSTLLLKGRAHGAAAAMFAAVAVVWSFPLARRLSTHLPGERPFDNVNFLWNFWWMREALAAGADPFWTPSLFVPTGVDLTLNTHTALPAFAGATVLGFLPLVAAHNLTLLAGLFLNGFCAYLLAWRQTGDRGAAITGGLIFATSPYVAAHLNGHFNLTHAWVIPLFVLAAVEAFRGRLRWAVASGLVVGLTAYLDYYYVVFQLALALLVGAMSARDWSIERRRPSRRSSRAAAIVAALVALDVALLVAILVTGGFELRLGPARLSAHGVFNPLQAFWLLLWIYLLLRLRPRVRARPRAVAAHGGRAAAVMLAVFLVSIAPLAWSAVELIARGDYLTQHYVWRSGPRGVDIATLVLGNPFHALWREDVQRVYRGLGIDPIESTAWPGLVPAVLAAWGLWRIRRGRAESGTDRGDDAEGKTARLARRWTAIGLVFFLWGLGPHLMAFGTNTGMILPQALLRYVPLVNNARVPGRAMVVAYLALAMLAAAAIASWRSSARRHPARDRRRPAAVAIAACAIVAESLPAPFPLVALDRPAIYRVLNDRPEAGALCELPMGVRDGFGERGTLDHRVLFYQTIHGRPITGGFVARLPPSVWETYRTDPLLSSLLRLSSPSGASAPSPVPPDGPIAVRRLRAMGIRFVMLNRRTAPAELIAYVERTLPLQPIASEAERSLYLVPD